MEAAAALNPTPAVKEAIGAGKHVFVEKTLTSKVDEGLAVVGVLGAGVESVASAKAAEVRAGAGRG